MRWAPFVAAGVLGLACARTGLDAPAGPNDAMPDQTSADATADDAAAFVDATEEPAAPASLGHAVQIAIAATHACLFTTEGPAYCWGDNVDGELGTGATPYPGSTVPVAVVGLDEVRSIAVAEGFTCAVSWSGGVFCWGWGPLVPSGSSNVPVAVPGLESGIASVAVSGCHACALRTNGGVWCWGFNENGELGDGTNLDRWDPVEALGLPPDVIAVSAGPHETCAATATHGAFCWGSNVYGQLGDGSTSPSSTPEQPAGLQNGTAAATSGLSSCAVTSSGSASCWGNNVSGQLGDGTTATSLTPVGVLGMSTGTTSISVGFGHACATTASGAAVCWGRNDGALGDGTSNDSDVPVDVVGIHGVTAVSAGNYASCAVTAEGAAFCWGLNWAGTLGTGSTSDTLVPAPVVGFP